MLWIGIAQGTHDLDKADAALARFDKHFVKP